MTSLAQQPVYGQPQIAQYMDQLNQLYKGGENSLSQGLAGRGVLNSGSLTSGLGNLQTSRLGNATGFMAQLPFQNRQAQLSGLGSSLGLASGFKIPYGSTTSSNGLSDLSSFQNMNGSTTGNQA